MSGNQENRLNQEELDWIQLRKELDEIRGSEVRKTSFSKETWYVPVGLVVTVAGFCYGFYHMNHPTKSIIGAYTRIFAQGITACLSVHVFQKFNKEGKAKKVTMDYAD